MITKLSFFNYKAFRKGEIKLKPITILLGANSVGKSSIINLILMLQQTASSKVYKSALRLHGANVSLGECENIFRNKDTSKDLKFEIEFTSDDLNRLLKKLLFDDFIENLIHPIQILYRFPESEFDESTRLELKKFFDESGQVNSGVYTSKNVFSDLLKYIETFKNNLPLLDKSSEFVKYYVKKGYFDFYNEEHKLLSLFQFLNALRKIKSNVFCLSFDCCFIRVNDENIVKIKKVVLAHEQNEILNIRLAINNNHTAYSDIDITSSFIDGKELLDKKSKSELLQLINYNSTIFSWVPLNNYQVKDFFFINNEPSELSSVTTVMLRILDEAISSIKGQFVRELVNHVSPLRAHPKRYYFLDQANINTTLDTLDGNSLTEILKENVKVKNKVNTWLQTFGLKVDVSTLQDVIHKLKIQQYSLDLDITDVGFGISQILPIIVQGFLSFNGSLTMVEQPEIHLHPKMQAELADLFIDIALGDHTKSKYGDESNLRNRKKYLLVETHSEYLLKRLIRRISEGKVSREDIAVYFIEPPTADNDSASIIEKEISKNGIFEWPRDFYEGELSKDNANYVKQLFCQQR